MKRRRKNCPKGMTACGHCQACIDDANAQYERQNPGKVRPKRVRGVVRGRSPEATLRQLNTEALVAIGYDRPQAKKLSPPTLAVTFGLVGHGYEIHVFDEGKYIGAGCRDFSDTHKVQDLKVSLMEAIEDAVKAWRAKL